MIRTFISQDPFLAISHPDLKATADNQQFLLTFAPKGDEGHFETTNTALADALAGLIAAGNVKGVVELGGVPLNVVVRPDIEVEAIAAKLAELTKPAEGETPAQPPAIAQLAEAFDVPEDDFKASLAQLSQSTPEAAEALKAAGIVIEPPKEKTNGRSTPRRGQRG